MLNWANRLTLLRIVAVPVFIASLLYYTPDKAYFYYLGVVVFLLACLTDGLDGYIAVKFHQKNGQAYKIKIISFGGIINKRHDKNRH